MVNLHQPVRPIWTCTSCGLEWPCPSRRAQLLAEYEGAVISLGLAMSAYLQDAAQDLPTAYAGDLYGRFLGWIRPRAT
jgi:hypothetical protein